MFDTTTRDAITYIIAITYMTEALNFFLSGAADLYTFTHHILYAYIIMFMFVYLLLYK
jgi:hypothetical protein